ncbi:hypothetical protein AK88_04309 [Plasmodium fragile]|uniref:VIR protein n=1 Tax=Plasmodium fragile TaxID=5857 RepID=A0A0D9QGW2_PLAFR|nr:uncharacterized protein AK88_04309 [Plasmodium fragile]KJP86052.1 hypothetical protein AK88_04309 [Plasmodium fragile]
MKNGTEREYLLKDTGIVKAMMKEYKYMTNWPDYNFDKMRGIYNSKFQDVCNQLEGKPEYMKNKNCLNMFSVADNLMQRTGMKVDDKVWNYIKDLLNKNKDNIDLTSNETTSYINYVGTKLQQVLLEDFKDFKNSHENNYELANIAMLFYFTQNIGNIKKLMKSQHDPLFPSCCEFVNNCLYIYRTFKDLKCSSNSNTKFSRSTLCVELNSFMEEYKNKLYPDLKHLKIIKTSEEKLKDASVQDPIDIELKCPYKTSKIEFLSNWVGYNSDLSYGVKLGLMSFSALLMFVGFLMLYKFTPLGYLLGRDNNRRRLAFIRLRRRYDPGLNAGLNSMGTDSEQTISYIPYYPSEGVRGKGPYASEMLGSDSTIGPMPTLNNACYASSQTLGGSTPGASEVVGDSMYASSQTLGGATPGPSEVVRGSMYASSETLGGSTPGPSEVVRGSMKKFSTRTSPPRYHTRDYKEKKKKKLSQDGIIKYCKNGCDGQFNTYFLLMH